MTDIKNRVQTWSPYAVDGGADAYGQMEEDDFGDYVDLSDYNALSAEVTRLTAELATARSAFAKSLNGMKVGECAPDEIVAAINALKGQPHG